MGVRQAKNAPLDGDVEDSHDLPCKLQIHKRDECIYSTGIATHSICLAFVADLTKFILKILLLFCACKRKTFPRIQGTQGYTFYTFNK